MERAIVFLLLIVTFACNVESKKGKEITNEINRVKSEAIGMHDVVMARMGEMRKVKASLVKVDSTASEIDHQRLNILIRNIDEADKQMWDWMHGFNASYADETDSLTLRYFQNQLESIQKVEVSIDLAISEGQSYTTNDGRAQQ